MRSLDAPEPAPIETPLDLYFFRPVGGLVARLVLPTPLPAIGVMLISIVVGLSGASLLRFQVPGLLVAAALLLVLYGILDRAEGELARERDTSSSLEALLHGASPYVVGVASAVTIAMNLSTDGGASVAVLGMGSAMLQGALSEVFESRYMARVRGAQPGSPAPEAGAAYEKELAPVVRGVAYLGPSTHLALLAVFLCAGSPAAYVWLRLTLGNVALALLYVVQRQRERALEAPPPPAEALPGPPVAMDPPRAPEPPPEPERKGPAPISFRPPPLDE